MRHLKGPWKACLNVPTATIPGHIIKVDDDAQLPIASVWEGGGTNGKQFYLKVAHLIAAAPELQSALLDLKKWAASLPMATVNSIPESTFNAVNAALAKAKGKPSKKKGGA
jgi:hypothetical protein